jgi:all-trans-8'-apo-beta-carotenal 15,15'-oxygenase
MSLNNNNAASKVPRIQESSPSSPVMDVQDPSVPGTNDFAPGIEVAFPREFQEGCRVVQCIQGEIPEFIRGTYYLNGPARFGVGDLLYRHWLDGDGMVCALQFGDHELRLTNRYVRSTKFENETQAGRPLFRTFGTAFPDSRLNRINNGLESPVNVSVYRFGDKLLAFGEQGLPWALNPRTLETNGQFTFQGRLNDASPFSAHPKFDADTREMFNFGIFFSAQNPRLYLYCFGPEGLRYRRAVPLEYPHSVHDFSLSKHYAVFYLSPYLLDVQRIVHDGRTVLEALDWRPEHCSTLMVFDRRNGTVAASIPVGSRYCLHLMNSFEQNELLVVDLLEFDAPIYAEYQPIPDLFQNVADGGPVRFVIDLQKKELMERVPIQCSCSPDFPALGPRRAMQPYEDFWMLGISSSGMPGRKFFDQLVHGNWNGSMGDVYQAPPMHYLGGEPVLIDSPDGEEAIVLCQELDVSSQASYFLLFDAWNVKRGPIARIAAEQLLYCGFHAIFHAKAEVPLG